MSEYMSYTTCVFAAKELIRTSPVSAAYVYFNRNTKRFVITTNLDDVNLHLVFIEEVKVYA